VRNLREQVQVFYGEVMRIVRYILGGEELGDGYCDEHCNNCEVKFQCYTTKCEVLIMSKLTPERFHLIQPYFLALKECKELCKVCGRYNWGSCEADKYGILIGELPQHNYNSI